MLSIGNTLMGTQPIRHSDSFHSDYQNVSKSTHGKKMHTWAFAFKPTEGLKQVIYIIHNSV